MGQPSLHCSAADIRRQVVSRLRNICLFVVIAARRADSVSYDGSAFETAVSVLLIAAVAAAYYHIHNITAFR